MAARALPALLYGEDHPYATTGLGDVAAVDRVHPRRSGRFHRRWLRPDNMEIFVVSNLPLAEVQPQLDARFGQLGAARRRQGRQDISSRRRPGRQAPRIVLIDRPGSPQSVILGGQLTPVDPFGDVVPVQQRQRRARRQLPVAHQHGPARNQGLVLWRARQRPVNEHVVPYLVSAPVQADRTGDSIEALTSSSALPRQGNDRRGAGAHGRQQHPAAPRPVRDVVGGAAGDDDQRSTRAARQLLRDAGAAYRALTQARLDQAFRGAVEPKGFIWVVVGDAAKVKPQLDKLEMPIEVIQPR